jgi:hypothetical protein
MSRFSTKPAPAEDAGSLGDQNLERLLALLGGEHAAGATVAELLASGVSSPAQSVYELQLAGYDIERVYRCQTGRGPTVSYHLRVKGRPSEPPV